MTRPVSFLLSLSVLLSLNAVAQPAAVKPLLRLAEGGDAIAQFDLGVAYAIGDGVPKSYAESGKWFKKAADAGVPEAQFNLGLRYDEFGERDKKHYVEAAKWYRRAADQGLESAQMNLGLLYYSGLGVPKDLPEAYKWANVASAGGNSKAVRLRNTFSLSMTPAQITSGEQRSGMFVARMELSPRNSAIAGNEKTKWRAGLVRGSGTGFLITKDGYLITNHHVVEDALRVKVRMGTNELPARVVTSDSTNDLALLKIDGDFSPLAVADSTPVRLGDPVFTVGFPNVDVQGVEPKLTKGDVNSLAGMRDDPRYFQVSLPVQPGNSGGALVDQRGNVVGVVTMRLGDLAVLSRTGSLPQNVNYAVKSAIVRKFVEGAGVALGSGTEIRPSTDAVEAAQRATVLVLTY